MKPYPQGLIHSVAKHAILSPADSHDLGNLVRQFGPGNHLISQYLAILPCEKNLAMPAERDRDVSPYRVSGAADS